MRAESSQSVVKSTCPMRLPARIESSLVDTERKEELDDERLFKTEVKAVNRSDQCNTSVPDAALRRQALTLHKGI